MLEPAESRQGLVNARDYSESVDEVVAELKGLSQPDRREGFHTTDSALLLPSSISYDANNATLGNE
jgi:hypothetical protein